MQKTALRMLTLVLGLGLSSASALAASTTNGSYASAGKAARAVGAYKFNLAPGFAKRGLASPVRKANVIDRGIVSKSAGGRSEIHLVVTRKQDGKGRPLGMTNVSVRKVDARGSAKPYVGYTGGLGRMKLNGFTFEKSPITK